VGRWSLGDNEGVNGLNFRTANDPRIASSECVDCAFDTSQQVPGTMAVGNNWQLANYNDRSDDVRLASGIEARLIEAEAQLAAGSTGPWLATLNQLRADFPSVESHLYGASVGTPTATLAALADPGTAAGRVDLMFRERAFWNFATGQRLADLRRLVRQYGRDVNTVFPVGSYWKPGANYGVDVNFIVPLDEENNPNFSGCLDRNP
jgi:hypothetical protein